MYTRAALTSTVTTSVQRGAGGFARVAGAVTGSATGADPETVTPRYTDP